MTKSAREMIIIADRLQRQWQRVEEGDNAGGP